jgi:hypothetical protein
MYQPNFFLDLSKPIYLSAQRCGETIWGSYADGMKSCSKCKEMKELGSFPNHKKAKDGKGSWCKPCVSKNTQTYISKGRELHHEKMKRWRENNPQYSTQWVELNQGYYTTYYHEKIKGNTLKMLKKSIRGLIGDSFKRGANGMFRKDLSTENILGCSIEYFTQHLQSQFTEGMTIKNHGKWHIDHIKPISLAKTENEVYLLCHYTNFQPLWALDNLRKSNKYN